MKDETGEEVLSLGLSLSSSWCSSENSKKRKRRDEPKKTRDDESILRLLRTRDRMLRVHPKREGLEDGKGLQLIQLLLIAATAVDGANTASAIDSLTELYRSVSLIGDPIQRVAAYFADGLAARLVTRRSLLRGGGGAIAADPTPDEEFLAFTEFYRASPYYQFAHFTANQAIIEAFDEEEKLNGRSLHVVDFDVSYGFQWPSLIQSLSDKATATKPITLRITGMGRSVDELRETEMRLASFANGCRNLVFEFEGLIKDSRLPRDLKIAKNSTVVVNLIFHMHNLSTSAEISKTLMDIRSLKPSAVVLVEKEGADRSVRSFLSGFMESLHYFAAMFDSLDDCLPAESIERLRIEKDHLGREIKSAITGGGKEENQLKYERLETWKGRMESSGFEGVKLSSRSVSQAKLILKIKNHSSATEYGNSGGFRIFERDEGMAISLGWQERHLITASAWRCMNPTESLIDHPSPS